jgi:hypothetical protein
MKKVPKQNIFTTPENYFEALPDQILERHQNEKKVIMKSYSRIAAAVIGILIVSASVLYLLPGEKVNTNLTTYLQEEIDVYISSGIWQAEDILSLADNPDSILDEIILQEWGIFEPLEDPEDSDLLF